MRYIFPIFFFSSVLFVMGCSSDNVENNNVLDTGLSDMSPKNRDHGLTPEDTKRTPDASTQTNDVLLDVDFDDTSTPPLDRRVVYGFYHFHNSRQPTYGEKMQWERLTHIAWSFLYLNKNGTYRNPDNAWPDKELVAKAHKHGVSVHLAVTLLSKRGLREFLVEGKQNGSWEKAITGIVQELKNGNADGVCIDFEHLKTKEERVPFVEFLKELRLGLNREGKNDAEIVIALGSAYRGMKIQLDLQGILGVVDYIFIMGYDIFGNWANKAGPTGILRITEDFARKNQSGTWLSEASSIADFTHELSEEQRKQLIWGVPYYGFQYPTKTNKLGSVLAGTDRKLVRFRGDPIAPDLTQRQWDPKTFSPWYAMKIGDQWHQVYYDDKESLIEKYRVAHQQALGGVGMWSLGEEGPNYNGYWEALREFETMTYPKGHRYNPIKIKTLHYSDSKNTYEGTWFFNFYGGECDNKRPEYGPEFVYEISIKQPGMLTATVTPTDNFGDLDVHLLDGSEKNDCIAQGDSEISKRVQPGTYIITVDSHVDEYDIDHYGPYDLDVNFVPQ